MMTPKQNFLETIHGGNPERFVKQYEFMKVLRGTPYDIHNKAPKPGEMNVVNLWGVTRSWPEGTPGAFPEHKPGLIVCEDVTEWRDKVKAPCIKYSEAEWEPYLAEVEKVNRDEYFVAPMIAPGLFESCHYLMEIQNTLMNFYMEPEEMKDLIKYLADFEIQYAEEICKYMKPSAIFQHDDWGSQISTFISPEMFEEFYFEPYKQVYGYFKENGVELIVHHSDSYAETLVPMMIEMGIDVWQGVMTTNDMPGMIKKYGGQISFMGGIDSAKVDYPGWSEEDVKREVRRACEECGKLYFIPSASQGLPISTYPGVYEALDAEIDNMSKEMFGWNPEA